MSEQTRKESKVGRRFFFGFHTCAGCGRSLAFIRMWTCRVLDKDYRVCTACAKTKAEVLRIVLADATSQARQHVVKRSLLGE